MNAVSKNKHDFGLYAVVLADPRAGSESEDTLVWRLGIDDGFKPVIAAEPQVEDWHKRTSDVVDFREVMMHHQQIATLLRMQLGVSACVVIPRRNITKYMSPGMYLVTCGNVSDYTFMLETVNGASSHELKPNTTNVLTFSSKCALFNGAKNQQSHMFVSAVIAI